MNGGSIGFQLTSSAQDNYTSLFQGSVTPEPSGTKSTLITTLPSLSAIIPLSLNYIIMDYTKIWLATSAASGIGKRVSDSRYHSPKLIMKKVDVSKEEDVKDVYAFAEKALG